MLGQPHADGHPRGRRLQADRQAARGRHRHRPGAHRHADAAQEGRGRQVRRILRRGPRRPAARRPRHHRQHGAGIRRDLRLLPGRRRSRWATSGPPTAATAAKLVEAYAKEQGLWRSKKSPEPIFTDTLELDLGDGRAEPGRPEAPAGPRAALRRRRQQFVANMEKEFDRKDDGKRVEVEGADYDLGHGDVVIAAITSCTNTSNPYVMLGAGLVARNAVKHGLKVKPWVKTSLAPGSQVVTEYLDGLGPAEGPRQDRLQPRRLRLHHLHRQLRPAARSGDQGDQRRRPRGLRRCSRATATSKAASIR